MGRLVRSWVGWCGILAGLGAGCGDEPVEPGPVPASVVVTPDSVALRVGQTSQLNAAVRDSADGEIAGVEVTYASGNPGVASVTPGGLVMGQGVGVTIVTASAGAVAAQVPVVIVPTPASVVITPDPARLRVGQNLQLNALVQDGAGAPIPGVAVTFSTDNAAVASVTPEGLVTAQGVGAAAITATVEPSVSAQVSAFIRRAPPLAIVASPAVTGCPHGIALASNGTGYVTQFCGTTATRFTVAGPTLAGAVSVGNQPPHVAVSPNGATAYVVSQPDGVLTVVDVASNVAVDTIPLGGDGFNVLVSPDGARVYVTTSGGTVFKMNAATRVLEDTVQVAAAANGLALHPSAPTLYVSSIFAASVAAINTATFTVERTYPVGGQLQRIAVSPSGNELYAANSTGLSIVNLTTGAVTPFPLGGETIGLALDELGEYVYLSVPFQNRVAVIDLVSRAFYGDISTGGDPRNITVGADGTVVIANQDGWFDVVR